MVTIDRYKVRNKASGWGISRKWMRCLNARIGTTQMPTQSAISPIITDETNLEHYIDMNYATMPRSQPLWRE